MVANDLLKSLYMAYIIKSNQKSRSLLTVDVMSNLLLAFNTDPVHCGKICVFHLKI